MAKDKLFSHGPLAAWIFSDKAEEKKKSEGSRGRGGREEKREGEKKCKYKTIKEIVLKWVHFLKRPHTVC